MRAGARLAATLIAVLVGLAVAYFVRDSDDAGPPAPPPPPPACKGDLRCLSERDTLWYQSSNGGETGSGSLPDYWALFTSPERWREARSYTDVMQLRSNVLRANADTVDDLVAPQLAEWGMTVALNSSVVTTYWCRGEPETRLENEFDAVEQLLDAGVDLRYIEFQSALSKKICPRPLGERVRAARAYVRAARERFPQHDFIYGVTDAQLAKQAGHAHPERHIDLPGIERSWRALDRGLRAEGTRLGFVHLDHPSQAAAWGEVGELADFVQGELGASAGITYTAKDPTSEQDYYRTAIVLKSRALRAAGVTLDHHVVNSWFNDPVTGESVPATELPEDAPDPRYPMTKLVRRLGEILAAYEETSG